LQQAKNFGYFHYYGCLFKIQSFPFFFSEVFFCTLFSSKSSFLQGNVWNWECNSELFFVCAHILIFTYAAQLTCHKWKLLFIRWAFFFWVNLVLSPHKTFHYVITTLQSTRYFLSVIDYQFQNKDTDNERNYAEYVSDIWRRKGTMPVISFQVWKSSLCCMSLCSHVNNLWKLTIRSITIRVENGEM